MLYKDLENLSNTLYPPWLHIQCMIIRRGSSTKSSQSTDSDEGCIFTMVVVKQYGWDLIPASVPWWKPAERGSTDHSVVGGIEKQPEVKKTHNLAPNIHVMFADTQRSGMETFLF